MTEAQRGAVELARFYFRRIAEAAGAQWDGDNDVEVEMMVSFIIDAARAGQLGDLAAAEKRIRELENRMSDAFALIRRLDRLRPTCVICLDATANRQTSRGPACTDCAGDLPDDGADPDRPETWAFGEAPLTAYPDDPAPAAAPNRPPCHYPDPQQDPRGHLRSDCSAERCGLMPHHAIAESQATGPGTPEEHR